MLTGGQVLAGAALSIAVAVAVLVAVLGGLLAVVVLTRRQRAPLYRELAEAHEQRALKLAERLDRCTSTIEEQHKLIAEQEQTIRRLEGLTDIASVHMIADANREQLASIEASLAKIARRADKDQG